MMKILSRKLKLLIPMLITLVLITATACQPTPDQPVVVQKDTQKMIEAATKTQTAEDGSNESITPYHETIGAPDTFTVDIEEADDKLKIIGEAEIVLPDVDQLPIVRVKAADFTQETVDGMIDALFGGQTLYEVTPHEMTKAEIEEMIINLERMKSDEEFSEDEEYFNDEIARYKEQYEDAPEESEDIVIKSDGQLKQEEDINHLTGEHMAYHMGLNVTTNHEDWEQAQSLMIRNNNDLKETVVIEQRENGSGSFLPVQRDAMMMYHYRAGGFNYGQMPPILVDEDTQLDEKVKEYLTMTPREAVELAEQTFSKAGVDDMKMTMMVLTDDEQLGYVDGIVAPAEHYAYQMFFCREVAGVPCAYIEGGSHNSEEEPMFAGSWFYEMMEMKIDDNGIIELMWMSPLEIIETVREETVLKPFDEIAKIFERQIKITYEPWVKDDYIKEMVITVDRVSLELQRIAEKNSIENGLFVPVWNFYGTKTDYLNEQMVIDGNEIDQPYVDGADRPQSMLTINAIDGSIIDSNKGY